MKCHVIRLLPQDDLLLSLEKYLHKNQITAGCIVSVVGSLRHACIRLANQPQSVSFTDKFEIVSLCGTASTTGCHLHISLADGTGKVIGGHLLAGCKVYTTVELVIGQLPELMFEREHCPLSGYPELVVKPNPQS